MLEEIPIYIKVLFIFTSLLTVGILIYSIRIGFHRVRNNKFILLILIWMMVQLVLAVRGFYLDFQTSPPRFLLAVIPPLILILYLTIFKYQEYVLPFSLRMLTLIHVIRIPVEFVLWLLYQDQLLPRIMTFEGYNWDILAGLSALIVVFVGFDRQEPRKNFLLIWNICCLGLLLNIVNIAVLSAPLPFQQLAYDQPNLAVFYFPFIWLPSVVVPIVLFCHLASIIKLIHLKKLINSAS